MHARAFLLVAAAAVSMSCGSEAEPPVTPIPTVQVADFDQRIKDYVALRNKVDDGGAKLKETKESLDIAAAQQTLAQRIRVVRADAKPGAIFTPEIREEFRRRLRPELQGREGAQTKAVVDEESPDKMRLQVNAPYPDDAPVSTVPPNILLTLPTLPEGLDYRFVGRHLILRDSLANLIVDFIPNALP